MSRGSRFALVAAVVAGCGGDDAAVLPPQCDQSVLALMVSAGTTPTFTWTPTCRLGGLAVRRVSDGEVMWYVAATGYALGPPVTYGVRPRGLETVRDPTPLVAGVTYEVDIAVPGSGVVPVLGRARFTP